MASARPVRAIRSCPRARPRSRARARRRASDTPPGEVDYAAEVMRSDGIDRDGQDSLPVDSFLRAVARATDVPLGEARLLAAGATLAQGRFEIARRLGAGGMGVVYAAHDHHRGCPVALKAMRTMTPEALRRLRGEFLSLHDLVHPNL